MSVGLIELSGSVEHTLSTTDTGRQIDLFTAGVPVPFVSPGLGVAVAAQDTATVAQTFWSQQDGWGLQP